MDPKISSKIEKFFNKYKVHNYTKGKIIILNGDRGDYIFQLLEGKVKQYDVSFRGDEIILNIFSPPAFFPMSLAINKTPNSYTYEAETNITIRQAPAAEVVDFIRSNPDVMFDLLSRVYKGVDGLLGRMVQLMTSSARSRLIYELTIEAKRFGTKNPEGKYLLKIHEKDLGARGGLSRETISREIHKLKAENLVEIHPKGEIMLNDIAAFEKILGEEIA